MQDSISSWLEQLGLGQYASDFADNDIDADLLVKLTDDDLKEIGIGSLGHRKKILGAIEILGQDESGPSTAVISRTDAERRQLTVMFCDLAGSTELSQRLDPEDLREINRAYQDACKAAIERYDGYVARYMGDGILAYFGYPKAHEDDAVRAIHAGLGVVESISALNETLGDRFGSRLGVRVGIATGPVVVGDVIGEGASQESAVVGETPNLAARLQAEAAIDSVVIGTATFNLAGGRFSYEDLGTRSLKGIAGPVQIWRVIGSGASESHFDAMHQSGLTPLVGRQHETGLLLERWEYARENDGQVVFFSGEAGIGKSRITETLCAQIGADTPVIIRYQCSAYHENSVLRPVIEQLERSAGINGSDSPEDKRDKVDALTARAARHMPLAPQVIAQLLSIPPDSRYPPLQLAPEQVKEATLEALVRQVETCGDRQPMLILFEDAHWSDPTSLEFIGKLVARAQTMRLLLIVTHRLEFTPPWDGPSHITSLRLNRLSRSRAVEVVEAVAGDISIPADVRDQIIEKADGVPLFLEELTRAIIETDLLQGRDDQQQTAGSGSPISIPGTLKDSLMARLDRSPSMREVAQVAAVIGREFSLDLLAAVTSLGAEDLQGAIEQLVDAALVFPDAADHYSFKHALVVDAAYESLLKANRKSLHSRIAAALEQDFPEKAENEPELLAHHFSAAGLEEPARRYWLKAGRRSIRQNAHDEAVSQLRRCLAMIESIAEDEARARQEVEIRVDLGVSLVGKEGGASPLVEENYSRALELCLRIGDIEHQYPLLWGLWFHHLMCADLSRASELAESLLEFSEQLGDEALILESHHCQWAVKYVCGDLTSALEHSNAGNAIYQPKKHHALTHVYGGHDPGTCALSIGAISLWLLGYAEQSREKLKQADRLASELDHTRTLANTLRISLLVYALSRDLDRVEAKARELGELAKTDNLLDNLELATGLRGWAGFQRGEEQQGLAMIRESLQHWIEQRSPWTAVPITLAAETLGRTGQVDEALRMVDEVLNSLEEQELHWSLAELYRVKAGLLLAQGPGPGQQAESAFRKAIDTARSQKAKSLELRATLDFARYLATGGQKEQAYSILKPVYDWFSEGFDAPDLKQAHALLAELGSGTTR